LQPDKVGTAPAFPPTTLRSLAEAKLSRATSDNECDDIAAPTGTARAIAQRYTDEIIAQIAAPLRPFANHEIEATFPERIREWAAGYWGWRRKDDEPTAAKLVTELARLHKTASNFSTAIKNLGPTAIYWLASADESLPFVKRGLLGIEQRDADSMVQRLEAMRAISEALGRTAERASASVPPAKHGRKINAPRHIAVRALAYIFFESAGKMPTRVYNDYSGEFEGRFREFCLAALRPIEGESAEVGLDPLIAVTLSGSMSEKRQDS
jgi:hypothetical protein